MASPGAHSPANSAPVADFEGTRIDQAYIGACTGAKLEDLRMASQVLRNKKSKMRLLVAPASLRDQKVAEDEGTLQVLLDAGAELLPNAVGDWLKAAADIAEKHLAAASRVQAQGEDDPREFALALRHEGYKAVSDFRIVSQAE